MALITCPDCRHEISDMAKSCPECGRPIDAITVEQTGKGIKGLKIISIMALAISLTMLFTSFKFESGAYRGFCILLTVASITAYVVARARAWWHHG